MKELTKDHIKISFYGNTFATNITVSKGIPIETVSKMLGHTKIQTTHIYARITNNKISKDMKGLSEKFMKSEKLFY